MKKKASKQRFFSLAAIIVIALVSAPVNAHSALQDDDADAYRRALPQFKKLLGSEADAKALLDRLLKYSKDKERPFPLLVKLTQRSLVGGGTKDSAIGTIYGCGLVADALAADDYEYGLIVSIIFDMRLRRTSSYVALESLSQLGVPAYGLVGMAIGKDAYTAKKLAMQNKLNVAVLADALLAMFVLKYGDPK